MAENQPIFLSSTDPPLSSDLQLPPASNHDAKEAQLADVVVPRHSLVQEPRWPHPSFGWSLLWCLLFWIITQLPGVLIIGLMLAALAFLSSRSILPPNTLTWETLLDPEKLYKSDALNLSVAVGQFFTEILVVAFSWLVIRLVVGRDWTRHLAMRRPSMAHTLLALASVPSLVLLGNVSYELLGESQLVPSISKANPIYLVYFWAATFVALAAALLAARLLAGSGWTRRLAARPTRPADIPIAAAVLLALGLCIFFVYEGLRWALPAFKLENVRLSGMEEMMQLLGNWPLGFAVLVIGLGPGIGEELWCRGFLGRGLVGNYGAVLGVLASSFYFGLIHLDPCQGTMAMVMGLWLHYIYLSTRSLLLPMLLHFLNNTVNVLSPRFAPLKLLDAKPQEIPLSVYITALLLLGSVAYALYQSRARLAGKTPEQLLVWRPAFEGVEYPPSDSGTQVVHPLPSPAAAALAFGSFLLFVLAFAAWLQQVLYSGG